MADGKWAASQLSRLLGLDDDSARQVYQYTATLSKGDAAEHLKNMLGDSPQALEFISSFNSRRGDNSARDASPAAAVNTSNKNTDGSSSSGVPKSRPKKAGKKPLNSLPPPRRPDDYGHVEGGYHKKGLAEDYMPGSGNRSREASRPNSRNMSPAPATAAATKGTALDSSLSSARSMMSDLPNVRSRQSSPNPKPTQQPQQPSKTLPPSAAGTLISDLPNVRSRQASPNPNKAKAKVNITGGVAMHGASAALNDLDSAIRSLEMQTNPATMGRDSAAARACDCMATRHPLLAAAPNCLGCGKIICAREGLGPCTFCSTPLLSPDQIQDMIRELKTERGLERQNAHNAGHRKADVSVTPRAFHTPRSVSPSAAPVSTTSSTSLAAAQAHRDKLLGFQAQNAQRTTVRDEAADFETPDVGVSMWSSPVERAQQLKRQQKILREMEWAARPDYEKRRVVMSVNIVGGKVVRSYGTEQVQQPAEEEEDEHEQLDGYGHEDKSAPGGQSGSGEGGSRGAFGRNPLIGGLIKPVWRAADGTANGADEAESESKPRPKSKWRRVQDDHDDNEELILDGGVYGGGGTSADAGARGDEPDCG